ncbi:MAG: hypothetical protein ABIQ01_08050 [Pseudolysinimonas sp.]
MVQLSSLFPSLSKKSTSLYGHSLGKGVQESWDAYHADCQAAYVSPRELSADQAKSVTNLRELGQANLGVHAPAELCAAVSAAFRKIGSRELISYLPRDEAGVFALGISKVLDSVAPVIEGFYGSYWQPYWISLQQNFPGTASAASSFAWHIDDNPRQLMKIFIYFNDVAESNGAFRAFTYPVSKSMLEAGFKSWTEKLRVENQKMVDDYLAAHPADLKVLEGTAGTVLMFDNNLVHKGTPPREGFRHLAQIEIYPSMTEVTEQQVYRAMTNPLGHDYPKDPRINDLSGAQLST